jgi:signal transduction histidine kinase
LSDGKLAIIVTDTGEGIPEGELPHIWKRFYKGQQASSGNGIGLSVVKELTELMGGEIRVQSELGVGSQFEVIFPLAPKKKARKEKNKFPLP